MRAAPRPDAARLAAQYRAALMAEAARYKRYPRFARDNGWEGRVGVRMAIGADGAIASLGVAHGSGYAILDRQALDMVRSAQPQTAIPEGLRGRAFSVDIPVLFSLRDPES
ncbi:MAG TPA: energy transducer TonB [Burkholderiales bacterium]|nr:energy transducer TonB [Burkholderiales bacterium]